MAGCEVSRLDAYTGMKVSAIVPVMYDEPQLADTLRALDGLRDRVDLEILVVVDVPDSTMEQRARSENDPIVADAGAVAIYRVGERGFGSALRRGFAESAGDVMIPVMSDRSENPEDVRKIERLLGWSAGVSLEEGLRRTVDRYRSARASERAPVGG